MDQFILCNVTCGGDEPTVTCAASTAPNNTVVVYSQRKLKVGLVL